jgi:glycopeptide antibiotics resistance protein
VPLGLVAATLPGATIWSVLTLGLAVSGTIEFVQLLVPGRFPSIDDAICNTLGALMGWGIASLGRRLLRGQTPCCGHATACCGRATARLVKRPRNAADRRTEV